MNETDCRTHVIQLLSNKYGFDIQEATTYIESIISPTLNPNTLNPNTLIPNTLIAITETPVVKVVKKKAVKPKKTDNVSIPALTSVIDSPETLTVPKEEKPVKEKVVKEKVVKEKVVKEKVVKEKPVKEKVVKEKPVKEKPVKEKKTNSAPSSTTPPQSEDEDNVFMKSIHGKHYFVNEDTGVIYTVSGDCEKGEITGQWGMEGPDIW